MTARAREAGRPAEHFVIATLAQIGLEWINFAYLIRAEARADGPTVELELEGGSPLRFVGEPATFVMGFLSDLSARRYVEGDAASTKVAPSKAFARKNRRGPG